MALLAFDNPEYYELIDAVAAVKPEQDAPVIIGELHNKRDSHLFLELCMVSPAPHEPAGRLRDRPKKESGAFFAEDVPDAAEDL